MSSQDEKKPTSNRKTREQELEEEKALEELNTMLNQTRPKHLIQGITSGVGYIVGGAVGACGIAVLAPILGAKRASEVDPGRTAEGSDKKDSDSARSSGGGNVAGSIVGGLVGGVAGAVAGSVQAVNVAGGGLVEGARQIIRGAAATPAAVIEPIKGEKWWNPQEGTWVLTDLQAEKRWVAGQPKYDEDILGEEKALPPEEFERRNRPIPGEEDPSSVKVKDMYYYDLLGADPSATKEEIKRRFFVLARKFSPDRTGANEKAKQKFREISNAYVVLSNDVMRKQYDEQGREGLFNNLKPGREEPPVVNPIMLYSFLFGSEKFDAYIGRLAATSSARVGDDPNIRMTDARLLQKRRVTRLAIALRGRLQKWSSGESENMARADWMAEAEDLTKASYGIQLVHLIGKNYSLSACEFLGSLESGLGLPSFAKWAKAQHACLKKHSVETTRKVSNFAGNMNRMTLEEKVTSELDANRITSGAENSVSPTLSEFETVVDEKLCDQFDQAMSLLWTQTVVDVTATLQEMANMVLHDQAVDADERKKRAEGLAVLGEIFENATPAAACQQLVKEQQSTFEKVAFHAMVDTIRHNHQAKLQALAAS